MVKHEFSKLGSGVRFPHPALRVARNGCAMRYAHHERKIPAEAGILPTLREKLLQSILESLRGAELGHAHRGDLDGGAGSGVASGASGAHLRFEDAETGNRYLLAILEVGGDSLDDGFDSALAIGLRATDRCGNLLDEIHFICHTTT